MNVVHAIDASQGFGDLEDWGVQGRQAVMTNFGFWIHVKWAITQVKFVRRRIEVPFGERDLQVD